jgi:hypothetical protein
LDRLFWLWLLYGTLDFRSNSPHSGSTLTSERRGPCCTALKAVLLIKFALLALDARKTPETNQS